MKKIKTRLSWIYAIVFCICIPATASAALFTVDIKGLADPSGIDAITLRLDVSDDFAYSNLALGTAIPPATVLGWEKDDDQHIGNEYRFGAYDMDGLFFGVSNFLKNGTIFTFDYSGTINHFSLTQFGRNGVNVFGTEIFLDSFTPAGALFSTTAVPLPGAAWLLGAGLLGLMGLRKRQ